MPITLTPEEKDAIHGAMEEAKGSIAEAARIIGIPSNSLLNTIHASPELRVRWADSTVATTPVFQQTQEAKLNRAAKRAEQNFDDALASGTLGLTGKEAQLASAYQKFHSKQFSHCVDMISGMVAVNAMKLNSFCERQLQKLNDGFSGDPEEQVERERMALQAYLDASELLRKYGSDAQKNAMMRALVEQKRGGNRVKRGKPGFQPLEQPARDIKVLAQSGSTVILEGESSAA